MHFCPFARDGRCYLRFADSSKRPWGARQGGGHGVPRETIAALERDALGDFRPDVTLVFDVPTQVGRDRLTSLGGARALDKFERQDAMFFERVRAVYLERAQADPQRCRLIDSTAPRQTVEQAVAAIVAGL